MVALNTAYASSKTSTRSENRVGDFFCEAGERVGNNRLASRIGTKGKTTYSYETASGRPVWPSRDPIGELGGLNLYQMVRGDTVNTWDYLGLTETKSVPWLQIEYYRGGELVLGGSFSFGKLPWLIDKALSRYGDYNTILALGGTRERIVQKETVVPECYILKDRDGVTDAGITSKDWHWGGSRKPLKPGEPMLAGISIDLVTITMNYWRSIEYIWIPDPKDECCK